MNSDHVVAGSVGQVLSDVYIDVAGLDGNVMVGTDGAYTGTPPTAVAIASDVWNSLKAAHAVADSFGAYLNSDIQTAIASSGAGAPTASDVAQVVWDSRRSDHVTAGSTGQALSDAYVDVAGLNGDAMVGTDGAYTGTPPTAAAIADATLNELLSDHVTPGSLSKIVSDAAWEVSGLNGEAMVGTDGAYTGTPPTSAAIASDTWNSLQAAHVVANSMGQVVSDVLEEVDGLDGAAMVGTNGAYTGTPASSDAIADAVWDEQTSTHTTSGSAGQALSDAYIDVAGLDGATMVGTDGAYTGTPPTSAAIAAATLDELLSDHVVTGSLSKIVSDAAWEVAGLNGEAMRGTDSAYTGTPPTAAAIASDTWNSLKAAHAVADTFGAYLNSDIQTAIDADGGTAPTASDIAGVVWDSRLSDHVTANSTGQALSDAYIDVAGLDGAVMRGTDSAYTGTPPTAAAIASDTWNSLQTAHVGAGTFGQVASDVLAEVDGLDGEAMRGTNSANTAAPPPASDIAQFVLKQSMSDIEDVAALNSLATIIQASLESNMTTSSDWIIYKTDGTTQLQARQVTSDSSASPITRVQ